LSDGWLPEGRQRDDNLIIRPFHHAGGGIKSETVNLVETKPFSAATPRIRGGVVASRPHPGGSVVASWTGGGIAGERMAVSWTGGGTLVNL